jgi:long-chain fatty acid transport protein
MNFKNLIKTSIAIATVSSISCGFASGFQLWEQDGSGIGDYHAGAAVDTSSAGIEFYNPAGMVFMQRPVLQASAGATFIGVNAKFNGKVGLGVNPTQARSLAQSTNGWVDGSTSNFVPNAHIVAPINNRIALGFGVTTPFGLQTLWPNTTPIESAGTKTKLETININPSIAFKANNWLGFGVGVDAQYAAADFDDIMNMSPLSLNVILTDYSHFTSWAWGWNAGVYIKPSATSSVGLAYRSGITHKAKGKNTFIILSPAESQSNNITATLPLPATVTLSAQQTFNKWQILASTEFTNWHTLKTLTMKNMSFMGGSTDVSTAFNYRNSWNFAAGVHYTVNKQLILMAGTGFDMTPTNNTDRDIRLPGTDRVALALGLKTMTKGGRIGLSAGYTHLFATNNAPIHNDGPTGKHLPTTTTDGTAKTSANVLGMQVSLYYSK